jgi:hypothetical protein
MSDETPTGAILGIQDEQAATNAGEQRSPLDRLRSRYRELQGPQHKDLDVPGYQGDLVARYKLIDPDVAKARGRQLAKIPAEERLLIGAIDQLIEACDSIWVRNDDGDLEPLDPSSEIPVRYDQRLAEILGIEGSPSKPRQVVQGVFTVEGQLNRPALISHAEEVGLWMQDVDSHTQETFLGE